MRIADIGREQSARGEEANMRAMRRVLFFAVLATFLVERDADAAISGLTRVASGLGPAMFATYAPGDRTRLFIEERGGAIKILDLTTGSVLATPFLSIPSVVTTGEGGLLGMAFHPEYQTNGKFYVNVTLANGGLSFQGASAGFSNYIREYTVSANPNVANTSFTPILDYIQPQPNHNGGWIGFSPNNGYLYIPTGDGGNADDFDPDGSDTDGDVGGHTAGTGNAQDITSNPLGKILRVDVNGDDFMGDANRNYRVVDSNPYADVRDQNRNVVTVVTGDDEIWAIGLRNPFRDSFDRLTGDLWLGDVGQGSREEIDRQPSNAAGGDNFGWRLREGNIQNPTSGIGGAIPANYRAPVYDYARPTGNATTDLYRGTVVSGGYVYRGPDPSLQGKYFFLDSRNTSGTSDDNYWMFDPANPTGTVININSLLTADTGTHQFPVSFGEDAVGNLYITYLSSGEVYRIATNQLLKGDFDADGDVDNADYDKWRSQLGSAASNPPADGNNNATADAADYAVWRKNLGANVHAGAGAGLGTVPEPVTLLLLIHAGVLVSATARLRRRGLTSADAP
jgi:glucose/arabinose dehydrogenase